MSPRNICDLLGDIDNASSSQQNAYQMTDSRNNTINPLHRSLSQENQARISVLEISASSMEQKKDDELMNVLTQATIQQEQRVSLAAN